VRQSPGDSRFVSPPARQADPTIAQPIQIRHEDGQQFPAQVAEINKTSSIDRAKAFSLKTVILGFFLSVFAAIGAWAMGVRGTMTILVVSAGCYAVVWVWAYWQDVRTSPGGIALRIAIAKLAESNRHSRDYSDAYRAAHNLPPVSGWRRLMEKLFS